MRSAHQNDRPGGLSHSLIVRGRLVHIPEGPVPASIHISRGRIESVRPFEDVSVGALVFEAGEMPVLPGLVDTHVHINEPGRTEWEGFTTATRAAAAGGVTTLVDMPLNSVPATTSVEGLRAKIEAARGQCWVDVGFWGGVVPGNTRQIQPLLSEGVLGFKCFLTPSGVDEFPFVTEADLWQVAPELARLGSVLLAHAEMPSLLLPISGDPLVYRNYLNSRPKASEHEAIALLIRASQAFGARIHIVHLSSADAVPMLRQARGEGLPITVETCPHYLTFAAEDIPDGATEFKCAPPIRERENGERLWDALEEGDIDLVATDHSPCPPSMKSADFASAWGGIASLQLSLAVMWKHLAEDSGADPLICGRRPRRPSARGEQSPPGGRLQTRRSAAQLARWMSAAPATLAGLADRKGAIAPGRDADIVIWNPDGEPAELYHRHKLTPYRPADLSGAVEVTFLRGQKIYERGHFASGPLGAILKP